MTLLEKFEADLGASPKEYEKNRDGLYMDAVINAAWYAYQLALRSLPVEALEVAADALKYNAESEKLIRELIEHAREAQR